MPHAHNTNGDGIDASSVDAVLAALIRQAGGSVRITRAELDDARAAGAAGRSGWLFDVVPSSNGDEFTVHAIADAHVSRKVRRVSASHGPDTPVGGVKVAPAMFAWVLLHTLIHQAGGTMTVRADSYRHIARLAWAGQSINLRPEPGPFGAAGDFVVHMVVDEPDAAPPGRSDPRQP